MSKEGEKPSREVLLDPKRRLRELSERGSCVDVKKAVPVKRYFRSGSELERQASVYFEERQLDKAFILYIKFATLFVEKLPKHPGYGKATAQEKAKINKLHDIVFTRAAELKSQLKEQFEREKQECLKEMEEEKRAEEAQRETERKEREAKEKEEAEKIAAFLAGDGGVVVEGGVVSGERGVVSQQGEADVVKDSSSVVAGMESAHGESEQGSVDVPMVKNAAYEQISLQKPPQQTTSDQQVQATGSTGQFSDRPADAGVSPSFTRSDDPSLTATNPDLARVLPPVYAPPYEAPPPSAPPPQWQQSPTHLGTDLSPQSNQKVYHSIFAPPAELAPAHVQPGYNPTPNMGSAPPIYAAGMSSGGAAGYYQPPVAPGYGAPPVGYQPHSHYAQQYSDAGSAVTGSSFEYQPSLDQEMASDDEDESHQPQVPDRSTKPSYSNASSSLGCYGGCRPMVVPSDIARRFEEVASSNTRRNVETCGILAGKLSKNVLQVTTIVVPKQTGQADSCETLNEEEIFDVQDQYELITLGWIHTHPSQTAFMSSVDLHTHCSYQIMLDEAIAIVCAPKFKTVGVFTLTNPCGLNYITNCEEPGFHTHPKEPPLYEDCKHVQFQDGYSVEVVDLR